MADRLLIGRFPGPAGQAATVQIGTVSEGPAGVTNVGTTREAILDFSIPKGDPGTSVEILGSFATQADLIAAHPVGAVGQGYLIEGDLWVWTATQWENVGRIQGPTGPTGGIGGTGPTGADSMVAGPTGQTGPTGVAATVTVGTTSTGNPGTNAVVTNSGNTEAAVFNFTVPRGDVGAAGTITVGTVTTADTDDPAEVTNSGDAHDAIFDFVLPRGEKGDTGAGVTIIDTLNDTSELPATATLGHAYLIAGDLWIYAPTATPIPWENVGHIRGPTGATGATGETGSGVEPEEIPAGSDLNDYRAPGFFYAVNGNLPNGPSGISPNWGFSLLVQRHHNGHKQTLTHLNRMFIRHTFSAAGVWSVWQEVTGMGPPTLISSGDFGQYKEGFYYAIATNGIKGVPVIDGVSINGPGALFVERHGNGYKQTLTISNRTFVRTSNQANWGYTAWSEAMTTAREALVVDRVRKGQLVFEESLITAPGPSNQMLAGTPIIGGGFDDYRGHHDKTWTLLSGTAVTGVYETRATNADSTAIWLPYRHLSFPCNIRAGRDYRLQFRITRTAGSGPFIVAGLNPTEHGLH